jgi:hypothetical protein
LKKRNLDDCTGKPLTFKASAPSTPTATAKVTSPTFIESDSEDINQAMNRVINNSDNEEFGFNEHTLNENIATCTVNRVINLDTFPKYHILKETEFVKDKSCIICFKSDLNLEELTAHMMRHHDLSFYEDDVIEDEIDEWIYVTNKWDTEGCVYESAVEVEPYDGSEDQVDSDVMNHFYPPSSNEKKNSGSNSDSSSGSSSSKKKKNKTRKERSNEKMLNKVEAATKQNEAKFAEVDKTLDGLNNTIAILLEDRKELKSLFKTTQSNVERMSSTLIAQSNSSKEVINTIKERNSGKYSTDLFSF